MYGKNRDNKYVHVVVAVLYAAILLTEGGEFFVSDSHKTQIDHDFQTHQRREIPEHIPEKYESTSLRVIKVCKQKLTSITSTNHPAAISCFIKSILNGENEENPEEIKHRVLV